MHRLQLIKFALATIATLIALAWVVNVRIVRMDSPDLRPAPFGYEFRGQPFTGFVYERYAGGTLAKLISLYRGRRQGLEVHWYDNGQRWVERRYHGGLEVGEHRAWYEDGRVRFLKHFVEGLPHGEFFNWHYSGHPSQYILYEHGREVAAKSWTAGGKPFYNYVWRDGVRVGLEGDTYCSPKKLQ